MWHGCAGPSSTAWYLPAHHNLVGVVVEVLPVVRLGSSRSASTHTDQNPHQPHLSTALRNPRGAHPQGVVAACIAAGSNRTALVLVRTGSCHAPALQGARVWVLHILHRRCSPSPRRTKVTGKAQRRRAQCWSGGCPDAAGAWIVLNMKGPCAQSQARCMLCAPCVQGAPAVQCSCLTAPW